MFTTETAVYDMEKSLNGELCDVSFGVCTDGQLSMAYHERRHGSTRVIPIKRIWHDFNHASCIGGHAHWKEIHVRLLDDRVITFTPNSVQSFDALIKEIEPLCA